MTDIATLLYAVALLLLVREGARRLTERRFDVWFVVAGIVVATAVWLVFPASAIPVDLVTELHEGRTARSIRALYARGAHSLQAHDLLLYWASSAEGVDIRDAVRLNLALTVLAAWLVMLYAARLGGRWSVGVVAAAVFLASPPVLNAAVSSYGAPLGTAFVLLALPSIERMLRADSGRRARAEAFLLVLALLLLASLSRKDWLVGLVLWVPLGAWAVFQDATIVHRAVDAAIRIVRPWPVRVGLVVGLLALNALPLRGKAAWVMAALQPLAFELGHLPSVAATLAVPLGVVALGVVGTMRLLRLGPVGWWGPLATAGLFKMFLVAGHGVPFEYLRYLCAWVAPALLLAAVGWRVVASSMSGWRLGVAGASLVALSAFLSPWLPSSVIAVYGHEDPVWPLSRDKQREVRRLLTALETYPECLFVTRVSKSDTGRPERWKFLFFGEGLRQPLEVEELASSADPLADAVKAVNFMQPRCVMLYRGLDCNLTGVDCSRVEKGLEPIIEWKIPGRHYSDRGEYGPWKPSLHLGIYRFPLSALASNGSNAPP